MHPLKAIRHRLWRRLEPRIQGVVSQRLEPLTRRLAVTEATAKEALALAREARRLAGEAAREVERLRGEVIRPLDGQLRATTTKANEAHRLAMESARAIERILQSEVRLWQELDAKPGAPGAEPATVDAKPGG